MEYKDFIATYPLLVPNQSLGSRWDGERLLVSARADHISVNGCIEPGLETENYIKSHRYIHEIYHMVEVEPIERIFKKNFGMCSGRDEENNFPLPTYIDGRKCAEREARVAAMERNMFIRPMMPEGATLYRSFDIELEQMIKLYRVNRQDEITYRDARAYLKKLMDDSAQAFTQEWFWERLTQRYTMLQNNQGKIAA